MFISRNICAVVVVIFGAGRVHADPEIKKIPSASSVFFAAELGTTPDILGMGFERNLSTADANGDSHRVHPAKHIDVSVNEYNAKFEQIDNNFSLGAHGHYLFVEAGVTVSTSKRYMVVRAYQINKVTKLITEGKPGANAPMYASKIYYGWALYVVVEGDSSTFTADVAANLKVAGGKLDTTISQNKLTSYTKAIGLKPKKQGDIPIATTVQDVQALFDTTSDPQPIFVEYTLMQDMVADAIPWTKNVLKVGRYAISVDLALMDNKASGRPWDVGSLPDSLATLLVNNKPVTSCKQQDSMESHCLHGVVIDVDQNTTVSIGVVETDPVSDDPVGSTVPLNVMSSGGTPGAPIDLKTTGQLRSAKLTLTAVGQ